MNDRGREGEGEGKEEDGRRMGGLLRATGAPRLGQPALLPQGSSLPLLGGDSAAGLGAFWTAGSTKSSLPRSEAPCSPGPCIYPAWGPTAAQRDRPGELPAGTETRFCTLCSALGPLSRDTLAFWFKFSLNRCCVPKKPRL